VTDLAAYRASMRELGSVWREHFGRRYPAMAVLGVTGLFDPKALVELVAVAVIP
jgi:enamine deaminase RidA (YjgF/YER057c/UK114 family)